MSKFTLQVDMGQFIVYFLGCYSRCVIARSKTTMADIKMGLLDSNSAYCKPPENHKYTVTVQETTLMLS